MDNGCIQKDRRLILDHILKDQVVGFDALHHFEVVAQDLFVQLLERISVKWLLLGFETAHLVHNVQSLVFGLVQRENYLLDIVKFVQECFWGYIVNFAQISFRVQDWLVKDRVFLEHIALECFKELFELLAVSADNS